jgi:hypothetical protein
MFANGEIHNLIAILVEKRITENDKSFGPILRDCCEGRLEIIGLAHFLRMED